MEQENTEILLAALGQLDPKNVNHWTADGKPKIETVKFLSKGQSFTREEIESVAPGFARDNPVLTDVGGQNGSSAESKSEEPIEKIAEGTANETTSQESEKQSAEPEKTVDPVAPTESSETQEHSQSTVGELGLRFSVLFDSDISVSLLDSIRLVCAKHAELVFAGEEGATIESANNFIAELHQSRNDLMSFILECEKKVDVLIKDAEAELGGDSHADSIQAYLKAQRERPRKGAAQITAYRYPIDQPRNRK